jgi:nucleoside-diphosphate-sugar epimerase
MSQPPPPQLRALVIGATGYTGQQVVAQLGAQGHGVWAHVRPDSPQLEAWRARAADLGAHLDTTPFTPDAFRARLTDLRPDLLFLLLGTTRARAKAAARQGQRADYEAIDYGLTALVIDAACDAAQGDSTHPAPKLIYLSSMGVTPGTSNLYLSARARIERKLALCPLPWVSARPSFITGPDRAERRPAERAAAALSDAALNLLGLLGARALRDRFRSISAHDLAAALIRLATSPDALGVVEAAALRSSQDPS